MTGTWYAAASADNPMPSYSGKEIIWRLQIGVVSRRIEEAGGESLRRIDASTGFSSDHPKEAGIANAMSCFNKYHYM